MKQVIIVIPKRNSSLSSIAGTLEILQGADEYWQRLGRKPRMEVRIAAVTTEPDRATGFYSLHPVNIKQVKKTDLLIIPSLSYKYNNIIGENEELVAWIREQYKNGAEIAGICTGVFLLAASGLLDGKNCSTHWEAANDFRQMFPNVQLHIDKLITAEQGIYTNGGGYSFLNLVLFLVEKYFDRQTAIFCSKVFQIDMERSSQSPFHIFQVQKNHGDEMVGKAQAYIEDNLGERISFEHLASKLAISRRSFDRRFIKATGNTPVEYLQRVKVEMAKRTLEKGRKSIFEVMSEVGYSDDKAFREVFKKITGLSPQNYKIRYNQESVSG